VLAQRFEEHCGNRGRRSDIRPIQHRHDSLRTAIVDNGGCETGAHEARAAPDEHFAGDVNPGA